jgi:hypothetical protein
VLADLQITLGAAHGVMTQKRLNVLRSTPGFQKMRGKTVPQGIIILLTNSLSRRFITDITRFMERKSK